MAAAEVLVIGDVMLDQFVVGRADRISPEAPVPVVIYDHEQHLAGGAANVALNARGLGARVDLAGVVGDDDAAAKVKDLLRAVGIAPRGLITEPQRRTTTKLRIVTTRNQQVARIDYESDDEIRAPVEDALSSVVDTYADRAGAIVVSDYLKGVITRGVMAHVIGAARERGIPVLVDPKMPHLDYYGGVAMVTPNHHEAEAAAQLRIRTDEDARTAAASFRARTKCEGVLITRGEHGMWLSHQSAEGHLPATAREVADVTGAGDTVIAVLALAVAAGATWAEAAWLANEAAGIVVAKFGPATVRAEELISRFATRS